MIFLLNSSQSWSESILLVFAVRVQASPGGREGGGGVEEVFGAEEAPRGAGLHAQEPVQKDGGVPTFSARAGFRYVGRRFGETEPFGAFSNTFTQVFQSFLLRICSFLFV